MAISTELGIEQWPLYEPTGYPQLDRYHRIEVLDRIEGFLPATKPEQVESMGLQSVIEKPWGTSKHLAEIALGRNKEHVNTKDPEAAVRKIVHDYVGWAADALASSQTLATLKEAIAYAHPEVKLKDLDELENQEVQAGLLKFLRFYDLSVLARTGEIEAVGYDPQLVNYSTDNPGIMYYLGLASEVWGVHSVRSRLPDAEDHESRRFLFWMERLTEVKSHSTGAARAIAAQGIDKIHNRQTAK